MCVEARFFNLGGGKEAYVVVGINRKHLYWQQQPESVVVWGGVGGGESRRSALRYIRRHL